MSLSCDIPVPHCRRCGSGQCGHRWQAGLGRSGFSNIVLDRRQPPDLTADKLLAHSRLPLAWHDQRNVLGFA